MKNSIKFAVVAALAVAGIAACTPTENAAPPTSTPSSTSETPPPSNTVITQTVTSTVTNPPKAETPAKPVIGSFGYGKLKLGMTLQQALDTKLIGPAEGPEGDCSLHAIVGTSEKTWVSKKLGVASINFTPAMSSDGVGVGATEQKLKAEYTNLRATGPNFSYVADADGNSAAWFGFSVLEGKVTTAMIALKGQDCFN